MNFGTKVWEIETSIGNNIDITFPLHKALIHNPSWWPWTLIQVFLMCAHWLICSEVFVGNLMSFLTNDMKLVLIESLQKKGTYFMSQNLFIQGVPNDFNLFDSSFNIYYRSSDLTACSSKKGTSRDSNTSSNNIYAA